ncbi:hypothetical protein CMU25_18490 [Elizabethkingia anophelis]|nr:hypothetical protein [Elizabethkingia anophelis]MDV3842307.1 hypothetical protein [Elizabethkingia anophelis]
MKKLIFSLLLVVTASVKAQKIEVIASYGIPSIYGIGNDLASGIISSVSNSKSPTSNGVVAIGVMAYNNDMKWRFGVDATNEFFSKTESVSNKNITSILPKADYFWFRKDRLKLYSGAAVGVSFENTTYVSKDKVKSKDKSTNFGYNVVPIGLRYGGDFSVFIETNIGMKGIAQAGVSYRF